MKVELFERDGSFWMRDRNGEELPARDVLGLLEAKLAPKPLARGHLLGIVQEIEKAASAQGMPLERETFVLPDHEGRVS